MPRQIQNEGRRWYAVHTYSGYEENVMRNLRQRMESLNMGHLIFDVVVPTENKIRIKNGKRKVVTEKVFPGYVLVDMIVTDESWYVVRNTPNVTGFVGSGTTPTPIPDEEVKRLLDRMQVPEPKYNIDVLPGSPVRIVDGPFKEFEGKVSDIDEQRGKVKVLVEVFGRETPLELDFLQIAKI